MAYTQARQGVSTPIEAAAAFAQASRPAQRVAFNAACRVVVPNPSEVAKAGGPAAWPAHKPAWQARRSNKHLPVEVRLSIYLTTMQYWVSGARRCAQRRLWRAPAGASALLLSFMLAASMSCIRLQCWVRQTCIRAQERLWRLRAKRAWIREQVQALRGFPDAAADADYAEPWSEALGEL